MRQGADVVSAVGGVTMAFTAREKLGVQEEEDVVEDSSVDDESDDVVENDIQYSLGIWLMVDTAALSADSCARGRSTTFFELVIVVSSIAVPATFSRSDVTTFISSGFPTCDC